ncbi:MAG: hypothetical protein GY856_37610 [bacterium]|nr:hypothetical protein [bacterium]
MTLIAAFGAAGADTQPACDPLPPPSGAVIEVTPGQAGALAGIVAGAAGGTTILLADGTYDLSGGDSASRLAFSTPDVTLRSASGNRGAVVLDAAYETNELISIYASRVTIADLTLKRAFDHPIHISGPAGQPISGVVVHNVHIVDPGQQAIKVNPVDDGYVDQGTVECSRIELTDAGRRRIRDQCYTGGIDVHQARGWVVRRNRIEGFWCNDGLSEHGIHFWRGCRDTLVEDNVIVDCARGIGFGLGAGGGGRTYPDDPYPGVGYLGHVDGIIRNNFIAAADARLFASANGFDTGIGLEQARGTQVVHNTVASLQTPFSSSIEWRFDHTLVEVSNNLVSHNLLPRQDAQATLAGNIEDAPLAWWVDVASGDLHLTSAEVGAVDAGTPLAAGLADTDIDGELRGARPDVGADEYGRGDGGDEACEPDVTTLCLNQGRFRVRVRWRDFAGGTGNGRVAPVVSADSGLFWFFDAENWEMLVKVLDGCAANAYFWVFSAATTNVRYTLRVTDTETGAEESYFNPLGNAADAVTDTGAFATCP